MIVAPVLETERLLLRQYEPSDLPDSAAMWADPAVVRYIGGVTQGRDRVWTKLLAYIGHWHAFGFGFWCLRERATGRYVGEAGLADFRRDITPSFEGAPEAGWALASWAHGQGIATEAMRAVLAWSDATLLHQPRTVCMIDHGHVASVRVAQKLGFRHWADTTLNGTPLGVFERPRGARAV
ncbi:MAG TPA: GNAT family N-acetyltransferase [Kofleriaceae bacterium]|nr:GNAT family N-acetyltransferase [Kofleriaceae bacterium]